MVQRTLHVAAIMDGNGRWAAARGLPRSTGHRAGVRAVRRVVECAPRLGVTELTLYAFSQDNWCRPRAEVAVLLRLLEQFVRSETARCVEDGVVVRMIGRRDRLPVSLVAAVEAAESATAGGDVLQLNVAVDYSGRDAIRSGLRLRDVDLLIRTGGEQRLSDFLLWECAYAELYFTPRAWPDFDCDDLAAALAEYRRRDRRFGGLAGAADAMTRIGQEAGA